MLAVFFSLLLSLQLRKKLCPLVSSSRSQVSDDARSRAVNVPGARHLSPRLSFAVSAASRRNRARPLHTHTGAWGALELFRARSSVRTESQKVLLQLSDWPADLNDCSAISILKRTKSTADKVKPKLDSLLHMFLGRYLGICSLTVAHQLPGAYNGNRGIVTGLGQQVAAPACRSPTAPPNKARIDPCPPRHAAASTSGQNLVCR